MNNLATAEPIDEERKSIRTEILEEIIRRKDVYKKSPADMISAFNREIETEKEYNGRQLLELLQNADDENSEEVSIELDTENNVLSIKNKGIDCTSFSANGVRSLMISNLSTKTSKKFIGNKGLGFRSIINWSERVSIRSNRLKIEFSNQIVNDVFDELFSIEERNAIRKAQKLPDSIYPIPFLSVPKVTEDINQDWNTSIDIGFKDGFLGDIRKQIDELKSEILLFLNSIQTLTVFVDGKCIKSIDKVNLSEKWNVYEHKGVLPKELWDKENEEEFFDLKIALQDNLCCDIREVFAYFPTKLAVDFPFIIHGTFELNSSRNEINDSKKNRFILKELVNLIVDTAKTLTRENASYKALELLSYKNENNILFELGFYDEIDSAIEELEIFPCLDGSYKKKSEVIFIDSLSLFISSISMEKLFPNLLIPNNTEVDIHSFELNTSVQTQSLTELSKNIVNIEDRASMIHMFYTTFNHKHKYEFLIDSEEELISLDDEVYTPSTVDISVPDYVSIKFIHKELYELLLQKFEYEIDSSDKARELQRLLKEITNIQQYQPTPVLQKIVSNANRLIKDNEGDAKEVVTKMVSSLYENYSKLSSPQQIPDSKIQLYNQSGTLVDARNMYLSDYYPSGELTEFLFKGIFAEDLFLSSPEHYGLMDKDPEELERFFLWLGVNKHSKFIEHKNKRNSDYEKFVFQHVNRPAGYRYSSLTYKEISKFNYIAEHISLEKMVIWFLRDSDIFSQLDDLSNSDIFSYDRTSEHTGYYGHSVATKPSFIKYQVKSLGLFKDFFFGNDKLSSLVNETSFDFEFEAFEDYGISRSDIESLLLKIGAIDKFEKLSLEAVQRAIVELPAKSPDGKQSQAMYKLGIKHFEHNNQSIDLSEAMLFAVKGEERGYFPSDKVFYNGNIKLPRKISSTVPILNYPRRQSTQNVTQFLGIQNLNALNVIVRKMSQLTNLTQDFSNFLEKITPYILVYRIQDIEKDQSARAELAKLKRYNIVLCEDVEYLIEREAFQLDNNDYIRNEHDFIIKVSPQSTIEELRHDFEFQETFADIVGLIFDIQDTRIFRDVVKEKSTYLEKIIRNDIGEEELIRTKELLGISDEYYSFWKTVYSLLGREYEFSTNKQLLENISINLNLKSDINNISYKDLNSYQSCQNIEVLFDELDIQISDFNSSEHAYYKIDFTDYHKRNLKLQFERNLYSFKQKLYTWCISNSKEAAFTTIIKEYESSQKFIEEYSLKNKSYQSVNYDLVIQDYINQNFELGEVTLTGINFDEVYAKNEKLIDVDVLEESFELISMLFFSHKLKEVENAIEKIKAEKRLFDELQSKLDEERKPPKSIKNVELDKPKNNGYHKPKNKKPFKHSNATNNGKKVRGNKSEKDVYESLVETYGADKVTWVSKVSDGDGYDIKYINECGITKYVEVKTYSGNKFFLTINELEFARQHTDDYEIFLVSDDILKICNVDFDDKERFHLESREYVVSLFIQ
ncbi:DUF3883 domain-containing protein [Psychrosphaera sp. 1_MG-2023]|uniref:DUF3883 domain-containing protein n=1 Tax=Psychrosphaera sp. 1_MG-2023 TaxID=3062643 RepID=UPI0026E36CD6|nr:DUF3883 domain-containing protein [Psychrosphaera sp. 1_MG-2023]MDO6720791.1 DUF3883 domain-containing protein [Psychrosphaera sp. 1_MG-2023]